MKLLLVCLLALALIAGVACPQTPPAPPDSDLPPANGEETPEPPDGTPPPDTQEPEEPPPPPPAEEEEAPPLVIITGEDIEAARQVVFAYWEAYNSYDLEGVLAFLEESWREERADIIAQDMGQMESAGMTMGVEEEAEPEVTAEGTIAIKMFIDIPVIFMSDRHYIYYLKNVEGEWKIYLAEEVEE